MEMRSDCHDQEEKNLFPFSDHLHYAMMKRRKKQFSLVTTFTTP